MPLLDLLAAKQTLERKLERVRVWYGCCITGYVVMPEHVHLLISERERGKLSLVIQMLKPITSRKLKPPDQPRFWQVRYYDFPVVSEAKRIEKPRDIHRNPVKRGLVRHPENWSGAASHTTRQEWKAHWRSSRSGQRVVVNGSESYQQHRKPTLPHRTREGWGSIKFSFSSPQNKKAVVCGSYPCIGRKDGHPQSRWHPDNTERMGQRADRGTIPVPLL